MRWPPLLLVALVAMGAPAAGQTAPYAAPANVAVDNPFGPDAETQLVEVQFRTPEGATSRVRIEARDALDGPVWMRACVVVYNVCAAHGHAENVLTLDAVPGLEWPHATLVRVWVSTARVGPGGAIAYSSWGGLRASFDGVATDDIVPYVASGQTGPPDLSAALGAPRPCDETAAARCATLPSPLASIRVAVRDDLAATTYFTACVQSEVPVCRSGTNAVTLHGPFDAGATVDVRAYALLGTKLVGTKGYAQIHYTR